MGMLLCSITALWIFPQGKWSIPFDPKDTVEMKFYVDSETTVPVQMMQKTNYFYTYFDPELSTTVLRLDYNDSFSMILALSDDLSVLQEALRPYHIAAWNRLLRKRLFGFEMSTKFRMDSLNVFV